MPGESIVRVVIANRNERPTAVWQALGKLRTGRICLMGRAFRRRGKHPGAASGRGALGTSIRVAHGARGAPGQGGCGHPPAVAPPGVGVSHRALPMSSGPACRQPLAERSQTRAGHEPDDGEPSGAASEPSARAAASAELTSGTISNWTRSLHSAVHRSSRLGSSVSIS